MDLRVKDAGVLVTGGSRGIGLAIARAFAAEGARVAICARDRARLDAAAAEIGSGCLAIRSDLFRAEDCQRAVDEAAAAFRRLDVLVNNASTSVDRTPKSLEDATDAQLMERFMGKTMAALRCSRAALPHLRRAGAGRIVCIGGTTARAVSRGDLAGGGSGLPQGLGNSALANFVKHLSEEVAGDGITVNIVHPSTTRTDRHADRMARLAAREGITIDQAEAMFAKTFPIGRVPEPEDIAPLVLLLASPLAGAITGQSIAVDGGSLRSILY